jgi:hypothetical protein
MSYLEDRDSLKICQKLAKRVHFYDLLLKDIHWDINWNTEPNYCIYDKMSYADLRMHDIDLLQFRFQRENNKKESNEFIVQYNIRTPQHQPQPQLGQLFLQSIPIPLLFLTKTEYAYISVLPDHVKQQIQ